MKIIGQAAISVTATPQRTLMPDSRTMYTIQNRGSSNAAYFRYDPDDGPSIALFAGDDAALRALGAGKLDPLDSVVIPPGIPYLDLVCATGLTTTVEIEPGFHLNAGSDLGNVGLLDSGDARINPAKEDGQLAALTAHGAGIEQEFMLNDGNSATGWAVATTYGTDTTAPATDAHHVHGTNSIAIVKSAGTIVYAGIENAAVDVDVDSSLDWTIQFDVFIPTAAHGVLVSLHVLVGTDATNYNAWIIDDDELNSNEWNAVALPIGKPDGTLGVDAGTYGKGTGWSDNITYIALIAEYNVVGDQPTILLDHFDIHSITHVATSSALIALGDVGNNVNIHKVRNQTAAADQGVSTSGTLRVAIVDDDTNLNALLLATQITVITPLAKQGPQTGDGWDSVSEGTITALAEWVDVYVDNLAHIMPTASADDPAQVGAIYAGGMTHRIRCFGMTHLHIRNGVAGTNVSAWATVYGH